MNATRAEAFSAMLDMLAADFDCNPHDFLNETHLVRAASDARIGRRDYDLKSKSLRIITTGNNVVISAHESRIVMLEALVMNERRDAVFQGDMIARLVAMIAEDRQRWCGPYVSYVGTKDRFRPAKTPENITIELLEGEEIHALYRFPEFDHALAYHTGGRRPDVLATVARRGDTIVGVAGVSADAPNFWQIGINVLPGNKGTGIGRALVSRVAGAIFAAGQIPFYTSAVSNLGSRGIAEGLGFWPSWTEMYAEDLPPITVDATTGS